MKLIINLQMITLKEGQDAQWKLMKTNIIQCNLNHSWNARDVLFQYIKEESIAICTIAVPVNIPDSLAWFGSEDRRSAIYINVEIL